VLVRVDKLHLLFVIFILIQLKGFHQAFEYEGRTFAQMTRQEMSKISSRRRALMRLHDWMLEDMNNVSGT
jgi:hypothetical protein